MTTVAYRDGVMASDSQVTGSFITRGKKIFRLADGSLFGWAGIQNQAYSAAEWLNGDRTDDPPDVSELDVIWIKRDGSPVYLDGSWVEIPFEDEFMAIGSGGTAAMAVMHHGGSALEAVKIAAKVDEGSSGPFYTMKIRPARK